MRAFSACVKTHLVYVYDSKGRKEGTKKGTVFWDKWWWSLHNAACNAKRF